MPDAAARPRRVSSAVLVILAASALPALAERPAVCKRECREAIATCAEWRAPMKRKKAKRICAKELLPRCARDGLVECRRAPHYRGSFVFDGNQTGGTCEWPDDAGSLETLSVLLTVHNRDRDYIDASIGYGVECDGEGATLPWTVRAVRGDCMVEGVAFDWCAIPTLTISGLPPRTPKAPHPPATMVVDLFFAEWAHPGRQPCTIVYTGALRPAPDSL